MTRRLIFTLSLLVLLGVGCSTAVSEPTSTQSANIVATEVLVTETAVTTTSRDLIPTDISSSSFFEEANTLATSTPTPVADIVWGGELTYLKTVLDQFISWSPVKNEFVYNDCPNPMVEPIIYPEKFLFLASSPIFEESDITPEDFSCFGIASAIWKPDGQEIFLTGVRDPIAMYPYDETANVELWRLDKNKGYVTSTNLKGWYLQLEGWLDSNTILYTVYSGSMARYLNIHDLDTGREVANMWVHNPHTYGMNSDYIVLEYGHPDYFNSAAIFAYKPIYEGRDEFDDLGPNSRSLSLDGTMNYPDPDFFSSYSDWLPNHNQILVETWDQSVNIYESDLLHEKVIDLQLWDIESNTLDLVAEGAFGGIFSPEGNYFVYIIPNESGPRIELVIKETDKILFEFPVYLEKMSDGNWLSFESFSPNGRFLTFYSPAPELMIYDLEKGEFLPSVTAVPFTPLWSPDNGRFVYNDPENGLSIYEAATQSTYPLAVSGGERLSNPQWSFDGAYLSVVVLQEDGEGETTVLHLPQNN